MDEGQIAEFLAAARHATVAINRINDSPLISPVWYLQENDFIYFSITSDSAKYRYLKRYPKVAICIDGGYPDERAVTIYGTAELEELDSAWPDDILWRTATRYVSSDQHEFLRDYLETIKTDSVLATVSYKHGRIVARDYNR